MAIFSSSATGELTIPRQQRIQSIDLLRGFVMLLMAIDHVRVYSGIPAGGQTAGIFFTRWITHFCVPTFVFFSGTSAFLYGRKVREPKALSYYLLIRGLLLVFLELTWMRFAWTFNFNYNDFILAGVLWMLGWCMVLLSVCIWLGPKFNAIVGILIIAFQKSFHYVPGLLPKDWQKSFEWFWAFIYPTGQQGHAGIGVLYVLVPWIGVMMLGYGFGAIITAEQTRKRKLCLWIGGMATVAFVIAAVVVCLLNPEQGGRPVLFRLLDQRKYPPSILFLLMTLGPMILLIPFAEKAKGKIVEIFMLFGRVPLFYYLLHIPVIHLLALAVNYLREGNVHQDRYGYAPFTEISEPDRWGLPLLYLVYFIAVVILFFICRSYDQYKRNHPQVKWLKYL